MAKKPTHRQVLQRKARDHATKYQVVTRGRYNVPFGRTPDELNFPRFAASFSKLLQHEPSSNPAVAGLLTEGPGGGTDNYLRLLDGLRIHKPSSKFSTAALNGLNLLNRDPIDPANPTGPRLRPRMLINPRASKSLAMKGTDTVRPDMSRNFYGVHDPARLHAEISYAAEETMAEMIEVYAMALLRPVSFDQYSAPNPDIDLVLAALNSFGPKFVWGYDANHFPITAATIPVTRANLFRGPTGGDRAGSYLSVFLTAKRPALFPSGCAADVADLIGAGQFGPILGEDLLVPLGKDEYFSQTLADFAAIQNAEVPRQYPGGFFTNRTPIQTGRDIGNYVHVDNAYEEHIRAADILTGNQIPQSRNSPYSDGHPSSYPKESNGPTLGPADAWGLIGAVRSRADCASFAQKWLFARRARPEAMGGLIHLALNGSAEIKAHLPDVLDRPEVKALLDRVQAVNLEQGGEPNYLLSQMYPEGSPAHPSWPSDHATIAGACVTVIKAIFDDCFHWTMPDGNTVVIGQELDKLASNIALARDFGGVHFRTDGEHGIRLGEEVAIRYLQDHARNYREHFATCHGFTLTKRNGVRVCITPETVQQIAPCPPPEPAPAEFAPGSRNRVNRKVFAKESL